MAKKECDDSPDGKHEPVNDTIEVTRKDGTTVTEFVSVCNWCGKRL
jgi:hypothetical protein